MFGIFKRNKSHTVFVNAHVTPTVIPVQKGQTLLNAALNTGLNWPHKCKVGSCGKCKTQVLSGKVKSLIDFSYVLNPEELKQGFVLACQSELKSNLQVKINLEN